MICYIFASVFHADGSMAIQIAANYCGRMGQYQFGKAFAKRLFMTN